MKVFQIHAFKQRIGETGPIDFPVINILVMPGTGLREHIQQHHPELLEPWMVVQVFELGNDIPVWTSLEG